MDKNTAKQLIYKIGSPEVIEGIHLYIDDRIKVLTISLISAKDETEIRWIQGRIQELMRLKSLREELEGLAK